MKLISISWNKGRSQADLLLQTGGYGNLHHGLDVSTNCIIITFFLELKEKK